MKNNLKSKPNLKNFKTFMKCFLILVLGISGVTATAASELTAGRVDMDFEETTLEGWIVGGEGYRVELDKSQASAGRQSLCFTWVRESIDMRRGSFGYVAAQLPLKNLRGKRIRLSAALKTQGLQAFFPIWLRANAGDDPVAFKSIPRQQSPRGTTSWKKFTIEMDIPGETTELLFGAFIRGKGKAWVDRFRIDVLPRTGARILAIGGRVEDKEGKPVSGALVTAKTYFMETALAVASSNTKGEFTFRLPPGLYTISASAPGLTGLALPLRNFKKDISDLVLALKKEGFTIKGKIQLNLFTGRPLGETNNEQLNQEKKIKAKIFKETYIVANKRDIFGGDLFYSRPGPDGSFEVTVPLAHGVDLYMIQLDATDLKARPVLVRPGAGLPCVLEAAPPQPAPEEVIKWMKQEAIPLSSADAGQGFEDLQPLKKVIGAARIVGLGETSHGNSEIFRMKHRLWEFLVEEMGFSVFVMEVSWPNALLINDYVLHGKGDPLRLLAGQHVCWNTREVLALIKWMRAYNTDPANQKKIKFYGIDIHESIVGADGVMQYLKKVDPTALKQFTRTLSMLRRFSAWGEIYYLPQQECQLLAEDFNRLLHRFDRKKDAYTAKTSSYQWMINRQHVRFLQQVADYVVVSKVSDYQALDVRDRAMADNICWILDTLEKDSPNTRAVYWAHNYHISTALYPGFQCVPMGMYMRRRLGSDYVSIGFEFHQGTFRSRDLSITAGKTPMLLKTFRIGPIAGSFAEAMSRTGHSIFLLDLRRIPGEGKVHDWFSLHHVFKSIDSVFACEKDVQHLFRVPDYFDAVIFFDKISHTRTNPSSPLPRLLY